VSTYALIDANNFYLSCERVFDYTLRDHSMVVLSNNGGRSCRGWGEGGFEIAGP
jgi:nucleotidyltransferase/DNA polymerase involved in DNA repair